MTEWIVTNCESVGNTHDICQDHTEYMVSNNVYVGALADGVSSNKYSDVGAKAVTGIACREICENFSRYFTGELTSQDFVQKIQNEMNLMYANSYDFNQMKSTLLLCAICKNNYIIGHIGDGAVLCFGKDSYVISPPQENEVGGTATYTILDYNAGEHFQFKVGKMNYLDGFLMTSDGLLGNVYYSGVDVPQLAYELFGSVYKDTSPLHKDDRDVLFKQYLAEHIQQGNSFADDCSLFMIARKKCTGYVDYDAPNGFEADVKWPCKCGNMNRMDEIRCSNCRTTYTSLYPGTIVKINSKEGFFSKLHKWMVSGSDGVFDPGVAAEVIDYDSFTSICDTLKNVTVDKTFSTETSQVHSSNNGQYSADKTGEPQTEMVSKTNGNHGKHGDAFGKIIGNMSKVGIGAIKKGLRLLSETDSTYPKQQKSKEKEASSKTDIQKVFPIVLSYNQMVEAAYQLKLLPMAFVGIDKSISISEEQKKAVKAMFCYDAFLDLFQHDEDVEIIHYYNENNRVVAVYNGMTTDLYCKSENNARELLLDSWLIPKQCFSTELRQCNKLNTVSINYRKTVLPWNWTVTYVRCKADAAEMLRLFKDSLNKMGFQLDEVLANIWFVAGNRNSEELVAYILTNRYLLRLTSIDMGHVEVDQVVPDDCSALRLRDKYLITRR